MNASAMHQNTPGDRIRRRLRSTARFAWLAARPPLRDVWWTVRAVGLKNPPLPRSVGGVLFVCKGNICRSPFASARAATLFRENGLHGVRCGSAGILTKPADRCPTHAAVAAAAYGISLQEHRPRQLTRELIEAFEVIVVMEAAQLIALRTAYPNVHARIVLLPLYDTTATGYARCNIADPFGGSPEVFDRCYQAIDRSLRGLCLGLRGAVERANTCTMVHVERGEHQCL